MPPSGVPNGQTAAQMNAGMALTPSGGKVEQAVSPSGSASAPALPSGTTGVTSQPAGGIQVPSGGISAPKSVSASSTSGVGGVR